MRKIVTSAYMPTEFSVENISDTQAKVSAWPFEIGYGITLAHPLRRLIYLSTVGYAPTAIKIDGVKHEFDNKRGILEDIALFLMNIKNIRFKLKEDSKKEEISFSFKGPKEIKGEDLINDQVDVVNPEVYIATINEDAELNFTLIVEKGIGYVPSEEIRDRFDSDYIVLDAFFTPVKNVVYNIENVLFEDNPDHEKIVFTITTDGQITPMEAFKNGLDAMYQQMQVFSKISSANIQESSNDDSHSNEIVKLLRNISELNLSARSYNCLEKANIKYIGELALMDPSALADLKNLGKKSLDEIKGAMIAIDYPVGTSKVLGIKDELLKKIHDLKAQS